MFTKGEGEGGVGWSWLGSIPFRVFSRISWLKELGGWRAGGGYRAEAQRRRVGRKRSGSGFALCGGNGIGCRREPLLESHRLWIGVVCAWVV